MPWLRNQTFPRQDYRDMQITERPPTPFYLPGGTVSIATERWELERWEGETDPPDLRRPWGIKPKFSVNGRRSCAELAVLDYLRRDGWDGVWVSAFGGNWFRSEWFPPRLSGHSPRLAPRPGQWRPSNGCAPQMTGS